MMIVLLLNWRIDERFDNNKIFGSNKSRSILYELRQIYDEDFNQKNIDAYIEKRWKDKEEKVKGDPRTF